MADTITTKKTLRIENKFADNDTSTLLIESANDSISAAQIDELNTFMLNNQPILSKDGAAFSAIKEAKLLTKTDTVLDLS